MTDYLVKALAYDGHVRAYATVTTNTITEAQRRHDTWPTASAALGRAMTGGVLMGAMLKGDNKLTIKIEGDGPAGPIIVDSNAQGGVRGYITNPHTDLALNEAGKLDVRGVVGSSGTFSVVKDLGLRDYFSGQVELISGELGEDFTYYFTVSEQTPSSVGLGVLVNPDKSILAAGGFIIQLMPGTPDEVITALEEKLATMVPISQLVAEGANPEAILAALFEDEEIKILESLPVTFQCNCSKDRFARAIISLGSDEIESMIAEDGAAETQCHFCQEEYNFTEVELQDLLKETKQ